MNDSWAFHQLCQLAGFWGICCVKEQRYWLEKSCSSSVTLAWKTFLLAIQYDTFSQFTNCCRFISKSLSRSVCFIINIKSNIYHKKFWNLFLLIDWPNIFLLCFFCQKTLYRFISSFCYLIIQIVTNLWNANCFTPPPLSANVLIECEFKLNSMTFKFWLSS